jgi:hypothetical protein
LALPSSSNSTSLGSHCKSYQLHLDVIANTI